MTDIVANLKDECDGWIALILLRFPLYFLYTIYKRSFYTNYVTKKTKK